VKLKQGRQHEYEPKVEARRLNTAAVEKKTIIYSESVCNLSYLACKEHVPCYIFLCGLSGSHYIFPHCFIKGTNFWKKKNC
jgi:hypothetical protein